MCAGLAGIAAEGAVATVVAAEVSQRQEDLFRISDDSGLESLPGFTGGCQSQVNQTWTWDGRSWARHKQGSGPSAVGQGAMVYDSGLGQVLYVNRRGEAWAWTGAAWQVVARNGAPHLAEPGSQANPELSLVAAGYDEKLQKLVLALPSTTWSWDGRSWSQVSGGIDAADGQADPRAVGAGALGQLAYLGSRFLWTWDGSRWQSRPQPAGGAGTLGYDPTRGKLVAVRQGRERLRCRNRHS